MSNNRGQRQTDRKRIKGEKWSIVRLYVCITRCQTQLAASRPYVSAKCTRTALSAAAALSLSVAGAVAESPLLR